MVVKGTINKKEWMPNRILVPTNGSLPSRQAAEMAFALNAAETVFLVNIITPRGNLYPLSNEALQRQREVAQDMLEQLSVIGKNQGVRVSAEVQVATETEIAILDFARKMAVDLIILGTDVRPLSDRLFLGSRVEYILANAPCPVAIFNAS
jgi:nucleotide-binding universal stress UspA family protein